MTQQKKLRIGPESLPQFEDRVLYHIVDLTGDRPLDMFEGVSMAEVADRLAAELVSSHQGAGEGQDHARRSIDVIFTAVQELSRSGLAEAPQTLGSLEVRPTLSGRRKVAGWREDWAREREVLDRQIGRALLEDLEQQRRASPEKHRFYGRIDVVQLCSRFGVDQASYLSAAQRLVAQDLIQESQLDQCTLSNGYASITEQGVQALSSVIAEQNRFREAQEAWVEVARLRRQLQLAERTLPSLIVDDELRQRCHDLLEAEEHFDRVVREACVILENRVRQAIGAGNSLLGTALMEVALSPKAPKLVLSTQEAEQRGAMELYRGVMGFFRNSAGHKVVSHYSRDDALRFVAWIDLLLDLLKSANTPPSLPTTAL